MPLQGTPSSLTSGTSYVSNPILEGYVFASGIHKPEHSSIMSYKYPQYYATALLDRLGASEGCSQNVFSWNEMDRTRLGGTVLGNGALVGGTTSDTTSTFEVAEYEYASNDIGYAIVGDVLRFESGDIGRVTAVTQGTTDTTAQKLTVSKIGSGNWSAALSGQLFGHSHNLFPEASSSPDGRLYLPAEEWNTMSILRRSFSVSGSELTNKTYINDGKAWIWEIENIEMKEFARDREDAIMFGERHTTTVDSAKGIWSYVVANGVTNGYASATGIVESDIQTQIKEMMVQGCSNDIVVLCGADALADIQVALRDYAVAGALDYGTFGSNTAGLDFQSYKYMGKNVHFAYYELFDDTAVLPDSTASSSVVNFSKTALFLDFGSDDNGKKLLTLKHKEHDGISRKFIHAYETGMVNGYGQQGGSVSSGDDKFTVHYLSEIGLEFRLSNRSGYITATS